MWRFITAILLCVASISAVAQSDAKYQVGNIVAVTPHAANGSTATDSTQYEVSVQVGKMVYVVLSTVPPGNETIKYITGRQVLVAVGEKTLTYNNILGQSFEVPILRKEPAGARPK
jgi:hypothetical protein